MFLMMQILRKKEKVRITRSKKMLGFLGENQQTKMHAKDLSA
jgi:hypothetical protein